MADDYMTTAIAFGNLKNASLYFDYLVPINFLYDLQVEEVRTAIRGNGQSWRDIARAAFDAEFLPPDIVLQPGFARAITDLNAICRNCTLKRSFEQSGRPTEGLFQGQYPADDDLFFAKYFDFINDYGLGGCPLVFPDGGTETSSLLEFDDCPRLPILALTNLRLIDASNATWNQIAEFRRDSETRRRLRRLRLFAYDNYAGKPASYVEDDLLTKIADYEEAVAQWGFQTAKGAVNLVLDSRLSSTTAAGAMLASLLGHPAEALTVAAVAGSIQLGRVAIQLIERRFELQKLVRDNPISYITYSRKKLRIREGE